jgi:hypothetical protein
MKEYIEREAALQILEKSLQFSKDSLLAGEFQNGCIAAIRDDIGNIKFLPAADVAPIVHGGWLPHPNISGIYICSHCQDMYDLCQPNSEEIVAWQFCPNCGAYMKES